MKPQTLHWFAGAALIGIIGAALPPVPALALLLGSALLGLMLLTPMAGLAALLILAPLRTLVNTELPLLLPLDVGQILLLLFTSIWVIHQILHHAPLLSLPASPVIIPVLLFIAAGGLTAFSAISLSAWLTEWLKWWVVLGMLLITLRMGRGTRWHWIIFALVAAGAGNALVGIYIHFGGSGADHLLIAPGRFRAFGTFGQPNPFGGFLGLLTPAALMMAYGWLRTAYMQWRCSWRIPFISVSIGLGYAAAALIMLAGIYASWSRGAWLGMVVSIAAIAFALPRSTQRRLGFLALAGLLMGGAWFSGLLPDAVINRIASSTAEFFAFDDMRGVDITPENYAVVERLAHWQAALNMAQAHPWLGVGLGNYEAAYPFYRLQNWEIALGHAHNYYLNILAEAGMIGILAYGLLWFSIIAMTWQARQNPDTLQRCMAVGLFGTWAYLAFHSLLDNLYVNNMFIHLGALLGVLALIYPPRYPRTAPA